MDRIKTFHNADLSLTLGSATNVPVYRAGLLASRLEWDDLLYRRSVRHQPNSNAYGESHLHAEFVPRADSVFGYRRCRRHAAKPDTG